MLTITKIHEHKINYFIKKEYLNGDGEKPGECSGKGSVLLNIRGTIHNQKELSNVLHGYSPDGSFQTTRQRRN